MIKRFTAVFALIVLCLGCVVSCSDEATFKHCEIVITLSSDFEETGKSENFDMLLSNGEASVGIARIPFLAGVNMGIAETYSAKQFAEYFMYKTDVDAQVYFYGDMPYYSYYSDGADGSYFCIAAFYRTQYAYAYIVFAVDKSLESAWREKFLSIGASVEFDYSE